MLGDSFYTDLSICLIDVGLATDQGRPGTLAILLIANKGLPLKVEIEMETEMWKVF